MSRSHAQSEMIISVENVGGIDRTVVTLSDGVNVLMGRNATNQTSFLQAVMAALGSEQVSLKRDLEEGYVELQVDNKTYSQRFSREDGGVAYRGATIPGAPGSRGPLRVPAREGRGATCHRT